VPPAPLSYTYDADSRLTNASDPAASYTYDYDNLDRATSVTAEIDGLTPSVRLDQSYDAAGNRTDVYAYLGGTYNFGHFYTYDNLDRMSSVMECQRALRTSHRWALFLRPPDWAGQPVLFRRKSLSDKGEGPCGEKELRGVSGWFGSAHRWLV